MSNCNGCRVLKRECSDSSSCIIRDSLNWIENPQEQANALLFISNFFGITFLLTFLASIPSTERSAVFRSFLFEAAGRTVNPVTGVMGLYFTGNWSVCLLAVDTILKGGKVLPLHIIHEPQVQPVLRSNQNTPILIDCSPNPTANNIVSTGDSNEEEKEVPKILDLFH